MKAPKPNIPFRLKGVASARNVPSDVKNYADSRKKHAFAEYVRIMRGPKGLFVVTALTKEVWIIEHFHTGSKAPRYLGKFRTWSRSMEVISV